MKDATQVKLALRGVKRTQGAAQPRLPVTVGMLRYIRTLLDLSRPEHLTKWTVLIVAFAFLMRVGEYAAELDEHGACHFDPAKGLI